MRLAYSAGVAQPVNFRTFDVEELERLATLSLSSPDYEERLNAQNELRPLSHFEQWDLLKDLFAATRNQYAIFVLVRAVVHIVANEVVPHERVEIMNFINNFCVHNSALPWSSMSQLLRITATCLYLNWRSMVLTLDTSRLNEILAAAQCDTTMGDVARMEIAAEEQRQVEAGGDSDIGSSVMANLESSLQNLPHLMLAAGVEIVHHFTVEFKRSATFSIIDTFITFLLPRFFDLGARYLKSDVYVDQALQLCVACLEVPPAHTPQRLTIRYTTEDVLHFEPMGRWVQIIIAILDALEPQLSSLLDPEAPHVERYRVEEGLHLASLLSQISYDNVQEEMRNRVVRSLIRIAMCGFMAYPSFTDLEALMHHSSSIIVAVFERHPREALQCFAASQLYAQTLASLVNFAAMNWDEVEHHSRGSLLTATALVLEQLTTCFVGDRDIDIEIARSIFEGLTAAFSIYLEAVLQHSYMDEDADDINCPEALEIVNEELLRPVGIVLMSCENHFRTMVTNIFAESVELHSICLRLQQGGKMTADEVDSVLLLLAEVSLNDVNDNNFALVATRVALSRLSVIINIISMWISWRGGHFMAASEDAMDEYKLLTMVSNFATKFLSDDLTDLLMCMDVAGMKDIGRGSATLHVGILRSLLHFVSCIATSPFGEQPVFIGCATSITHFVLSRHSLNAPVLSADSIAVLDAYVAGQADGVPLLVGSSQVAALLELHLRGGIALTATQGAETAATAERSSVSSSSGVKSAAGRIRWLRKHMFRCLARILDLRYKIAADFSRDTFYKFLDSVTTPLGDESQRAAVGTAPLVEVFLSDVRGIISVVTSPVLLLSIMQWLMNLRPVISEALSAHYAALSLPVLKTWAKVARQLGRELKEDLASVLTASFSSAVFDNVAFLLQQKEVDGGADFVLSLAEQAAIAELLNCVLRGTWCNVGVMAFYGDLSLQRVVLAVLRKFVRLEPADVLSLKKRQVVFSAIAAALRVHDATTAVREAWDYLELCNRLAMFLVSCIRLTVTMPLLEAINFAFAPSSVVLRSSTEAVVGLFRELAIVLATNAVPDTVEGLPLVCLVLHRAYRGQSERCDAELETLLTQASAWHRVRLRCLLLMLRSDPVDLASQYIATFGDSRGTEQMISAW